MRAVAVISAMRASRKPSRSKTSCAARTSAACVASPRAVLAPGAGALEPRAAGRRVVVGRVTCR